MVDDRKQGGEELHHQPEKPQSPLAARALPAAGTLPAREEEILEFWQKEKIFEKSVERPAPKGEYVFYDGPPFANGLPHYGHILASTIKDAIPRYRTMRGYRVARRWGWDCHGLPVENLVEKELGFKSKKDIEEYGIEKFNEAARVSIMKDVADWKRIIPRLGRWADMEHDYKTMDASYTESVWWAFKTLHKKGLIYEGFKAMHLCPRCGTTLSNFEVALGYKDIEDIAATVKLPLAEDPGTSLLVWTTTPWTLPGNAAAAVNLEAEYWKVKTENGYVIASAEYFSKQEIQPSQKLSGKDLVGKRYKPPFNYFAKEYGKNNAAWKVYAADFVTLEDGTGIVHIAPAFGSDDLALAQKHNIPLIQHAAGDGTFVSKVTDFSGLPVKPKGNPKETDAKVVAKLAQDEKLFKEEKVMHSYPHCWRCDTPLLNWAATSWFVKVSALKSKLLAQNAGIAWVPEHVGKGRFQHGLESAPDWAISRSRYWGAPLPVWRHTKTGEVRVAGSLDELLSMVRRSGNRYFAMRHGEARSNVTGVPDRDGDPGNTLTDAGKRSVAYAAAELKREGVDLIISSPFVRTQETARIVGRELGLPESALMTDERLREFDGQSLREVRRRVGEFLFEIERRYTGKNILIVSHGNPLWNLLEVASRKPFGTFEEAAMPALAEVRPVPFVPFPHNKEYELDLHRPYIDDVPMGSGMDGEWQRIPDVFDCWFESGSMPFASNHYPFIKEPFNPKGFFGLRAAGYPADFIAEGLDQTRGWFYSLLVLGVALFGKSPYKHVIVNGLILASDGQKMSKRLRNYPDPMEVVEKYGADALRYYLLSSPVIRGEDLRFKEQGVDEVSKKLLMRLDNVRSFYEMYVQEDVSSQKSSDLPSSGRPTAGQTFAHKHPLDTWILSRLGGLIEASEAGYESYQLDNATRPLAGFIDDLSNWYLRRSRDRFKTEGEDKQAALHTLRYVLQTVAQVMAPAMPFYADYLYRRMGGEEKSVHLSAWPAAPAQDAQLLLDMAEVRALASRGLELRERAGIKVRQPLARFSAKTVPADSALRAIIAEELNVKEVAKDESLEEPVLDTELTAELREEGMLRELVRTVQDMRKKGGYAIGDRPFLEVSTNVSGQKFIETWRAALVNETGLADIRFVPLQDSIEQREFPFPLHLMLVR